MDVNVGIDLGTTYSAVSVFDKATGAVRVLKNELDRECTPSVICIENGVVSIGQEAKNLQAAGVTDTAAFYKSMMGASGYSLYIDGKEYTPEDLSMEYLKALKKIIEEENGVHIAGAVITVPAYFDEKQRRATERAGIRAGLNVLKTLNEPTAAIIAYGLTGGAPKTVLVYDLGGGTFDVTVARVEGANVTVLGTNGNHQLGGKDWDAALADYLSERFYEEYGVRILDYPSEYKQLQVQCEAVKQKLTQLSKTAVTVQCDGCVGTYEVTRELFESLTSFLLEQTTLLISQCFAEISQLQNRPFSWEQIDEVVLVGGSTRMPMVRDMVLREFGKPPVTKKIDVDTIVSAGAAIQAQLCIDGMIVLGGAAGSQRQGGTGGSQRQGGAGGLVVRDEDIRDVTAHSLGMLAFSRDGKHCVNSIIIRKNSPVKKAFGKDYSFTGKQMEVYVLQGESESPYESTLLYKYLITGMPSGRNEMTVSFLYNASGIVEVTAALRSGSPLRVEQTVVTEDVGAVIARLLREREESMARPKKVQVQFMIDVSGSMSDSLRSAKDALRGFIDELPMPDVEVRIVSFANSCRVDCDYTGTRSRAERAISSIDITESLGYGTGAKPLSEHGQHYDADAEKIAVVLTDGQWFNPTPEESAAAAMKKNGVRIYAVGFGEADKRFLERIASEKGARKIDLGSLGKTFREIASSIATELN